MRSASLPPRRPPRSTLTRDPAQFVLPFIAEPTVPRAGLQQDQPSSSQSPCPEESPDKVVLPAGSATEEAARKALRPAKARRADRALPAPARSQPIHKPVMRSNTRPAVAGMDSLAVSPNIVVLIESRAEAWSARELAKLIGCTGKHIYAMAKSGRMPHLRIGGMVRFDPATTAEWLRQRYIAA